MEMDYEIAFTHRCNGACKYCFRFLDELPWSGPKSDLLEEDLVRSGEVLRKHGIEIGRVKVSGGEPTLNPRFDELLPILKDSWECKTIRVFSNGTSKIDKRVLSVVRARVRISKLSNKGHHYPTMISPSDEGLEPVFGVSQMCKTMRFCGRAFDTFGFSFCALATGLGRVLNIDPYQAAPVMWGDSAVCRHCLFSQSRLVRWGLVRRAAAGKIQYPSKTFQDGIDRCLSLPMYFDSFLRRVAR